MPQTTRQVQSGSVPTNGDTSKTKTDVSSSYLTAISVSQPTLPTFDVQTTPGRKVLTGSFITTPMHKHSQYSRGGDDEPNNSENDPGSSFSSNIKTPNVTNTTGRHVTFKGDLPFGNFPIAIFATAFLANLFLILLAVTNTDLLSPKLYWTIGIAITGLLSTAGFAIRHFSHILEMRVDDSFAICGFALVGPDVACLSSWLIFAVAAVYIVFTIQDPTLDVGKYSRIKMTFAIAMCWFLSVLFSSVAIFESIKGSNSKLDNCNLASFYGDTFATYKVVIFTAYAGIFLLTSCLYVFLLYYSKNLTILMTRKPTPIPRKNLKTEQQPTPHLSPKFSPMMSDLDSVLRDLYNPKKSKAWLEVKLKEKSVSMLEVNRGGHVNMSKANIREAEGSGIYFGPEDVLQTKNQETAELNVPSVMECLVRNEITPRADGDLSPIKVKSGLDNPLFTIEDEKNTKGKHSEGLVNQDGSHMNSSKTHTGQSNCPPNIDDGSQLQLEMNEQRKEKQSENIITENVQGEHDSSNVAGLTRSGLVSSFAVYPGQNTPSCDQQQDATHIQSEENLAYRLKELLEAIPSTDDESKRAQKTKIDAPVEEADKIGSLNDEEKIQIEENHEKNIMAKQNDGGNPSTRNVEVKVIVTELVTSACDTTVTESITTNTVERLEGFTTQRGSSITNHETQGLAVSTSHSCAKKMLCSRSSSLNISSQFNSGK